MGSMLDMLQNMMDGGRDVGKGQQGKEQKEGSKPGDQEGEAGNKPGQGGKGGSAQAGESNPDNTAENSNRRVPRNSGTTGNTLPKEFHQAMDAYNRGVNQQNINPSP